MVRTFVTKYIYPRVRIGLRYAAYRLLTWSTMTSGKTPRWSAILFECSTMCLNTSLRMRQTKSSEQDSPLSENDQLVLERWASTLSYREKVLHGKQKKQDN